MKIIFVFSKNKERCTKFCRFIKNKGFIKNGATVHPLYYLDFFEHNEKNCSKCFNRVIDFINKNKNKEFIIIDNYLEKYVNHLIFQLNIKKIPITHFIYDNLYNHLFYNIQNYIYFNETFEKFKNYFIKNNSILCLQNHPKFIFLSPLPNSNLYKVIFNEFPFKSHLNNKKKFFSMFLKKRSCHLINGEYLYIVNPLPQKLRNLIRNNILLLRNNTNFNKLDFKFVEKYNFKGDKIINSEGIYFENETLRIF